MIYEIEFDDRKNKEYAANIIAENMLTQVDSDVFSTTLMEGIIEYRRDTDIALTRDNMYVTSPQSGHKRVWKTTSGWKLLVKWKDNTESWIPMKHMKESDPVEVAKFAKA